MKVTKVMLALTSAQVDERFPGARDRIESTDTKCAECFLGVIVPTVIFEQLPEDLTVLCDRCAEIQQQQAMASGNVILANVAINRDTDVKAVHEAVEAKVIQVANLANKARNAVNN